MSWSSLFQSILAESDRVILTANQGLARSLLISFGTFQKEQGCSAWQKPQLMAYQTFFQKWLMNTALGRSRLLLTAEQCEMVWRDIINTEEKDILLDGANTAKQARQAEALFHDYLLDNSQVLAWASQETMRFMKWRQSFWAKMDEAQWWPPAYGLVAVVQAIEQGSALPFQKLTLIGFEELTPLQKKWISALEHRGIAVSFFNPPREERIPQVVQMPSFEDELKTAALWAQRQLESEPNQRLGIVMPGLEVFLPQVKHHLGSILAPEAILGDSPEKPLPFHISLGRPLLQWRPVQHLFLFWRLLCGQRDVEEIDMIFGSAFMWGGGSFLARERFLGTLRASRKVRWGIFDLQRYSSKYRAADDSQAPSWADAFKKICEAHQAAPTKGYASYWSNYLTASADALGWLQGKGVDSTLFQLKVAVKSALEEAAKWDIVLGEVSLPVYLSHLKRIWQNILFQPESQNQPIRVLGILEAMGNEFDAVWVCRMNEGVWPPQGHPNPFIPARLQQEAQMPHASVQRELHFAKLALQWLLRSAPKVHLSFSTQENGLPMTASPLLKPWLPQIIEGEVVSVALGDAITSQVQPEYFRDWMGLPYEPVLVKGGASVLEYQAQCPFKAYALKRLRVEAPREVEPAVGADQHGELLHATLYEVWGALQSHKALLRLEGAEKEAMIRDAIDLSWDKMKNKLANTSKIFEVSEKRRVLSHVINWLAREAERPPFQVIEREQKYRVGIGDREFHLKVDRVDRLENGTTFCMDYKTGKRVTASELTAEPLEKVQLPLYALALQPTPTVLAYGVINAEKKAILGIGDDASLTQVGLDNKKVRKNTLPWTEQIELWREVLSTTLQQFLAGDASRTPIKESVCTFCEARPVCRVDETLQSVEVPHE